MMMPWLARPRKSGGLYPMRFIVVPRGRKPKLPVRISAATEWHRERESAANVTAERVA